MMGAAVFLEMGRAAVSIVPSLLMSKPFGRGLGQWCEMGVQLHVDLWVHNSHLRVTAKVELKGVTRLDAPPRGVDLPTS